MKTLLTIILLLSVTVAFGQKKDTSKYYTCDTCNHYLSKYMSLGTLKPGKFIFMNIPDVVLSISTPDSLGYYKVVFNRSKVKFINDTTFIFKITK